MRIDSPTLIPLLERSIYEARVRVPVVNLTNVQDIFAPSAAPDPDQRAAHSAGLVYGLGVANRIQYLTGDFANSRAAKQITTMGQVLEAARMLEAGGKVSDTETMQLVSQLVSGLEEVGKRLDKVDIDNQAGLYIAKNAAKSEALMDAAKAAEKTTMKLARKLGGEALLSAIAEKYVVPATLQRIEANFPELFEDGRWSCEKSFDVDDFLQREQMGSLHAKVQHGLASDSFPGLQQALNNLVKVPAMVLKKADSKPPAAKSDNPEIHQPKAQPPRGFPAQIPGAGAGNVNQSWAEGGKVGDITIKNPIHDTASHDAVVLEALNLAKTATDAALRAKDETIRAKDDMIAFLLQKAQRMPDALTRVQNVKSGPGSVDSGCGGDEEIGRADKASGPDDLFVEASAKPKGALWIPASKLREDGLRKSGVLDQHNATLSLLKANFERSTQREAALGSPKGQEGGVFGLRRQPKPFLFPDRPLPKDWSGRSPVLSAELSAKAAAMSDRWASRVPAQEGMQPPANDSLRIVGSRNEPLRVSTASGGGSWSGGDIHSNRPLEVPILGYLDGDGPGVRYESDSESESEESLRSGASWKERQTPLSKAASGGGQIFGDRYGDDDLLVDSGVSRDKPSSPTGSVDLDSDGSDVRYLGDSDSEFDRALYSAYVRSLAEDGYRAQPRTVRQTSEQRREAGERREVRLGGGASVTQPAFGRASQPVSPPGSGDSATLEKIKRFQDQILAGTAWRTPMGDLAPVLMTRAKSWPGNLGLAIQSVSPDAVTSSWTRYPDPILGGGKTYLRMRLENQHYTPISDSGDPVSVKSDGYCFPLSVVKALPPQDLAGLLGKSTAECATLSDDQKAKEVAVIMADSLLESFEYFEPYLAPEPSVERVAGPPTRNPVMQSYVLTRAGSQNSTRSSLSVAKSILERSGSSMASRGQLNPTLVMPPSAFIPSPPPPPPPSAPIPHSSGPTSVPRAMRSSGTRSEKQPMVDSGEKSSVSIADEDPREALLASIRKGVKLKKVASSS